MALATIATKEQINYLSLYNLLVDVGTNTLRRLFDEFHPPAILHEHLKKNEKLLLINLRINAAQRDKLFPSPPSSVKSETFDLKLLMMLFRIIPENMPRPAKGWGSLPLDSDRSVTANVVRVEYYRNKVFANASQMSAGVDDTTFNYLWQKISRALIELGADETVINRLKTGSKDPEEVKKDSGNINKKIERHFILYFFQVLSTKPRAESGNRKIFTGSEINSYKDIEIMQGTKIEGKNVKSVGKTLRP